MSFSGLVSQDIVNGSSSTTAAIMTEVSIY